MAISETAEHRVKAARGDERLIDVAGRAGISVSYLSMIEHGLVPKLATREKVAKALKTTVAELWPA